MVYYLTKKITYEHSRYSQIKKDTSSSAKVCVSSLHASVIPANAGIQPEKPYTALFFYINKSFSKFKSKLYLR